MTILHKSTSIEIGYDEMINIFFTDWIGPQNEQSIKENGEIILDLFQHSPATKLLNNNSRKKGGWYESVDYASNDWLPRMIELAGLKHLAWVFPPKYEFVKLSAQRATTGTKATIKTFTVYNKAYKWLCHVR